MEDDLAPNLAKVRGSTRKLEQVVIATLINAAEVLAERTDGNIKIATRNEDGEEVFGSLFRTMDQG